MGQNGIEHNMIESNRGIGLAEGWPYLATKRSSEVALGYTRLRMVCEEVTWRPRLFLFEAIACEGYVTSGYEEVTKK